MNRQTHQALAQLLRERLSELNASINELSNSGLKYWIGQCDVDRKHEGSVKEAYANLNRIKNLIRAKKQQRAKWLKIQREILRPLKVRKQKVTWTEP